MDEGTIRLWWEGKGQKAKIIYRWCCRSDVHFSDVNFHDASATFAFYPLPLALV